MKVIPLTSEEYPDYFIPIMHPVGVYVWPVGSDQIWWRTDRLQVIDSLRVLVRAVDQTSVDEDQTLFFRLAEFDEVPGWDWPTGLLDQGTVIATATIPAQAGSRSGIYEFDFDRRIVEGGKYLGLGLRSDPEEGAPAGPFSLPFIYNAVLQGRIRSRRK